MKAFYIGKQEYTNVLTLQECIFHAKIKRQITLQRGLGEGLSLLPDVTLLVEHSSPVYTTGRRDLSDGLPRACEVAVVRTRRGGGLTFHGPGQLTMYPIVQVQHLWRASCATDKPRSPIEWFSAVLEQAAMDTAQRYGLATHRYKTGVWVDAREGQRHRKLASIGLHLGSWVSMHGLGFNVNPELRYFDDIVMCEMPDERATSLHVEMQARRAEQLASLQAESTAGELTLPSVEEVGRHLYHYFLTNLRRRPVHGPDPTGTEEQGAIVDLSKCVDWKSTLLRNVDIDVTTSSA